MGVLLARRIGHTCCPQGSGRGRSAGLGWVPWVWEFWGPGCHIVSSAPRLPGFTVWRQRVFPAAPVRGSESLRQRSRRVSQEPGLELWQVTRDSGSPPLLVRLSSLCSCMFCSSWVSVFSQTPGLGSSGATSVCPTSFSDLHLLVGWTRCLSPALQRLGRCGPVSGSSPLFLPSWV